MRVAVAAGPGRTALLQELAEDGSGYAAPALVNDFPAAVAEYERARPGDEHVRWVWADTSAIYPSLLHSGIRVDRCHEEEPPLEEVDTGQSARCWVLMRNALAAQEAGQP